jgi:hypothetical protein
LTVLIPQQALLNFRTTYSPSPLGDIKGLSVSQIPIVKICK